MNDWRGRPHRRYNPLTQEWVLVSPHRAERPWLGERSTPAIAALPAYDPTCYLCPGNVRANGERNPVYASTFAFTNDYAALLPATPEASFGDGPLLARAERGTCRVVCFSPRHNVHIASLGIQGVEDVVQCWAREFRTLWDDPAIATVTIFENRGAAMGASNPHPHSQIWSNQAQPGEYVKESKGQHEYRTRTGRCLLCDYVERELRDGERVVCVNDAFIAVVPFWAVWPFEVLLVPRAHHGTLLELAPDERKALADAMRAVVACYDRLFGVPFPYTMGFHHRPRGGSEADWHLHAHYYPPLLRSADVRKYMVGYEMLAQPQRDITPEEAAARLRAV